MTKLSPEGTVNLIFVAYRNGIPNNEGARKQLETIFKLFALDGFGKGVDTLKEAVEWFDKTKDFIEETYCDVSLTPEWVDKAKKMIDYLEQEKRNT